jgi:hypothetical protein
MMNSLAIILFAALSVWDYPARQPKHEYLKSRFVAAVREGDTKRMADISRQGVALLPEDPVWHYNRACALAHYKDKRPALKELEIAIDLGMTDANMIRNDRDFASLSDSKRFHELLKYAVERGRRPFFFGPKAKVPATGLCGERVAIGEHNISWDLDIGCFVAHLKLQSMAQGGNTGDLYMNRDANHSAISHTNWYGLTSVVFDKASKKRGVDLNYPNMLFPYPVFGNSSRGFRVGNHWRSLSRGLMTTDRWRLRYMQRFYLSNQFWVFPAVDDYNFSGTNSLGDAFASVTPYWITTQGRSWSDLYYLKAALEISRTLPVDVKQQIVRNGLLSPVIQTIMRKSLKNVQNEEDYLSPKAHPTAFPPNGLDLPRMKKMAAEMKIADIPPVVPLTVQLGGVEDQPKESEVVFATRFATAIALRSKDTERNFHIKAFGADKYQFRVVHDDLCAARVIQLGKDMASVFIDKTLLTPSNRVDVAVFGKTKTSGWGAPSFISFALPESVK